MKRKIISDSSCLINNVHRNSEMGTQKLLHKMFLPTKNLARFGEFFFFLRQNHWHVWNPEISSNRISKMFSAWIWTIRKSVQYYSVAVYESFQTGPVTVFSWSKMTYGNDVIGVSAGVGALPHVTLINADEKWPNRFICYGSYPNGRIPPVKMPPKFVMKQKLPC